MTYTVPPCPASPDFGHIPFPVFSVGEVVGATDEPGETELLRSFGVMDTPGFGDSNNPPVIGDSSNPPVRYAGIMDNPPAMVFAVMGSPLVVGDLEIMP